MEETSEELPNFSIGIDFLGPDPTSSKNKAEKNLQVARFANLNFNHKNYNFLNCDWFKKLLFPTNSLAKLLSDSLLSNSLLSDSLLSDSSTNQSHSKL